MERKRKKTPGDYPQFAFRLKTKEELEDLNKSIEEVQRLYNKGIDETTERKFNKIDIIREALNLGLSLMKRNKK